MTEPLGVDTGLITGTKDRDYDLIRYLQACLENALRLEQHCADAEAAGDVELAELFRKAQSDSSKGAEIAKAMLKERLTAA